MFTTDQWERKSTIRNRPQRTLGESPSKYFFPALEQSLCLHPLIKALGEKQKALILTHSAYMFMQTIIINETEVICAIAQKIISHKNSLRFSSETVQKLLTIIIDETYHAYVANDFILQVSKKSGVKPILFKSASSLSHAIAKTKILIPKKYRIIFEIIAACIAENSITKELISLAKDPDVDPLFYQINEDHIADEGRHCRLFSAILANVWQEIPECAKDAIGPNLVLFIKHYLDRNIALINNRKILESLPLSGGDIDQIIYDTYPECSEDNFTLINPVYKNIISLLKRAQIFEHDLTAQAFSKVPESPKLLDIVEPLKEINLCFVKHTRKNHCEGPKTQSIKIDTAVDLPDCSGLLLFYLQSVVGEPVPSFIMIDKELLVVQHRFDQQNFVSNELYKFKFSLAAQSHAHNLKTAGKEQKLPLSITFGENAYDPNLSHALQVNFIRSGSLKMVVHYETSIFDDDRVRDLLNNFSYFLEQALLNKSILGKDLPLVCLSHRQKLLDVSFKEPVLTPDSILSLFELQVKNSPNEIAIVDGERQVTYLELNDMALKIAGFLQESYLPGSIIAILYSQSFEYCPIILGIMKASMVFLPLAYDASDSRLEAMIKETECALIIMDRGRLPDLHEVPKTTFRQMIDRQKVAIKQPPFSFDGLAYIIYTSGSTGKPKGVMISHGSIANFSKAAAKTFGIRPKDRFLQFAPFCFDPSLAEIFATLISGATLIIKTETMMDESAWFFSECSRLKVSIINLPTSFWFQIIGEQDSLSSMLPLTLHTVVVGGEMLKPYQVNLWHEKVDAPIRLLNTYGPTETTIAVTSCEIGREALGIKESLIGTSMAQASLYVFDQFFRLLPVGATGELYVGGPGLSLGYFKLSDLTKESFIRKGMPSNERLYKTGDRVKWIDGFGAYELILAYVDRIDSQIKIRGFRVELLEIEHALNRYPGVIESRVLSQQKLGLDQIAAFIRLEKPIDVEDLRSSLSVLPEYMRPQQFIFVKEWPKTSHGKIDDEALLTMLIRPAKKLFDDQVESRLAQIWQDLLIFSDISRTSNFFHEGGHSLLALRLLDRINREFAVSLTLRNILETPVLFEMAAKIKSQNISKGNENFRAKTIESGPLSFAQEALWVFDQMHNQQSINYNIAYFLHFKIAHNLQIAILEKSLNHIIERHQILQSVFHKKDGSVVQTPIHQQISLKPELATEENFKRAALKEARTPFRLSEAPPLRIRLFQVENDFFLLVNHHHIIHDGYSIGLFLKELKICYESFLQQKTPDLPKLWASFKDFAQKERDDLPLRLDQSLNYWREKLADYKPLTLPLGLDSGNFIADSGKHCRFILEKNQTEALRKIANQEDCTVFTSLLAILMIMLGQTAKTDDVALLSPISTREYHDDEHMMGMFINLVMLRQKIDKNESFLSFLQQSKNMLIDAFTHRQVPLETLSRTLSLSRDQNNRLCNFMVVFHQAEENFTRFETADLKADIEFIDNQSSKGITFDIYEHIDHVEVDIEYCPEQLTKEVVLELADRFMRLAHRITGDPATCSRPLSELCR